MGNQASSRSGGSGSARGGLGAPAEPLEAYLREKQRNDHLKNLGAKRQTSFRRSIRKKLKKVTGGGSSSSNSNSNSNNSNKNNLSTRPDATEPATEVDGNNCDINAITTTTTTSNHSNTNGTGTGRQQQLANLKVRDHVLFSQKLLRNWISILLSLLVLATRI